MNQPTISTRWINILTSVLLFLTFSICAIGVAYIWPREVVRVVQPVKIDNTVYRAGDEITGTFVVENYYEAVASFKRNIVCEDDKVQVTYSLDTVIEFPVKKTPEETRVSRITVLPDNIYGDDCWIETVGSYRVQILPLVERVYTYSFVTDSFAIVRDK